MDTRVQSDVKITTADPSALGLFGLAMVTLVASSQKLGLTDGLSLVLPWAFFLGGIAQLMAAWLDAKHNNIFGTTAFGAFGLFWFGVGTTWLIQMGVFGETLLQYADSRQLGVAFIGYLIFSLFMTVGALETNKVLFFIFVCIDFLFIGLALSSFGIMYEFTSMLAAISELMIALLSFYGAAAIVLNTHFGKVVVPNGKPFGIFKKAE
ncbi:acetate uptake transporter [Alkalihalobacillus pseudalcaliphilus]|uniref:acetate uptake transporter n=1 Tax=Alkalihalobacillus pseudalcaliphilus TaxID=79884 RepID=UPI00064DC91D|nr:GPR1/FUN34/YaaH family transporter [Alkalihalobacillus pseudalcaliphilus]KMK75105.1 membrane protein [Alkalihalobacillus pseudalcaliphilus]